MLGEADGHALGEGGRLEVGEVLAEQPAELEELFVQVTDGLVDKHLVCTNESLVSLNISHALCLFPLPLLTAKLFSFFTRPVICALPSCHLSLLFTHQS